MSTVKFGADEYELGATWGASKEFNRLIGDPLKMALDTGNGEQVFSAETTVKAIWIGLKHGGNKLTEDETGELCHKFGIVGYYAVATGYLVSLVSGDADLEADTEEAGKG